MGKKIDSIGNYAMVGHTLGKGSFARVELAVHRYTKLKVIWHLRFFFYRDPALKHSNSIANTRVLLSPYIRG